MPKCKIFLAIIFLIFGFTASAQALEDYDPNYFPNDLQRTRFPDCKAAMATDRTWPLTTTRKRQNDGRIETAYTYSLDVDFWKTVSRDGDIVTVNPILIVKMGCHKNILSPRFFEQYVRSVQAGLKKKKHKKMSAVQTVEVPGIGRVFYFTDASRKKKKGASDYAYFYFAHKGISTSVFISLTRSAPRGYTRKLKVGHVYDETMDSGKRVNFRLTSPALKNSLGAISGTRTKAQNDAFIRAMLTSLRGL